ncbi:hypothetical protein [Jeotgalicoccus meleagridis]|uniref:Uncharacterized protein n=1 Tax=Jeotgalicoccus meleagridis TaxID=2759181 RepID=A0A6V7RIQ1_9STAP|nr:hypothetical protein [Jeotgalicoccus meleagridis]CAD2077021.1 hypothetical protein JEODO184_01098 [Jeotgalicoccus meleagridis]
MELSHKNTDLENYSDKLNEYLSLLELTYTEAVQYLLSKYGPATVDYYSEQSYERFLRGEIKSITKRKYSRTQEGLYCHHIDENKFENLSNINFIRVNKYPFKYQTKDRLVYCDLFEHLILHTLIAKETLGKFGLRGYFSYIEPIIKEWYIDGIDPKIIYMKICKEKAFLSPKETKILLENTRQILRRPIKRRSMRMFGYKDLRRRLNLNMTIREYKNFKDCKLNMKEELKFNYTNFYRRKIKIEKEKEIALKNITFYKKYPVFRKHKIIHSVSRKSILNHLFNIKYKNIVNSKKELTTLKINNYRDELLEELHSLLEEN